MGNPTPEAPTDRRQASLSLRVILLIGTLFVFFLAINMMGESLKLLTESAVWGILTETAEHPLLGLLLGVLATSIVQSSSVTTSVVVALAASGALDLRAAIPMVMGANIGTSVTNTLVSFTHVHRPREFEKALAAGTVHDFFNILATLVLFPLELGTHLLEKSALWAKEAVIGTSFGKFEGLKTVVKPAVHGAMELLHYPGVSLAVALVVLVLALTTMVKLMRSLFITRMARALDRFLFRTAPAAFLVGMLFTILVQSSSVTTSLVVPLAGAGILTLEQIFPYTLGANVGTTITAFLAALALASVAGVDHPQAQAGVAVAVVHLLFNCFGIAIFYPARAIPLWLARNLARVIVVSRKRVVLFLILYFAAYLFPLLLILLF